MPSLLCKDVSLLGCHGLEVEKDRGRIRFCGASVLGQENANLVVSAVDDILSVLVTALTRSKQQRELVAGSSIRNPYNEQKVRTSNAAATCQQNA